MNALSNLVPRVTTIIRDDHAAVLSMFRKYRPNATSARKNTIAESICNAAEAHAKLEEEIFYPALRAVQPELVERSAPDHNEIRRHIAHLRTLDATNDDYDAAFLALMRTIIHHVADEETSLLPAAERALSERLGELGLQMTRRRKELARLRTSDRTASVARTRAGLFATIAALVATGGYFAYRQSMHRGATRWIHTRWFRKRMERPARRLLGNLRHA